MPRIPRPRLSFSGPAPVARPRTGPPTGEQFAALAVLTAIAEHQEAARRAAAASPATAQPALTQPAQARPAGPGTSGGDHLAALLAEIEAARQGQPGRD